MKHSAPLALTLLGLAYLLSQSTEPTPLSVISFHIGASFDHVVKQSSYPVLRHADVPDNETDGFGVIWVSEPAVIIRFDDPRFGFTLPPTTFAALGFAHFTATTLRTSASLKKLSFNDACEVLEQLQKQLKSRGWQLEQHSDWFDLSTGGRKTLRQDLRDGHSGHHKFVDVVVPGKYSLIFGIRCAERCDSTWNLDRYLIDIGIGGDYPSDNPK